VSVRKGEERKEEKRKEIKERKERERKRKRRKEGEKEERKIGGLVTPKKLDENLSTQNLAKSEK
jgi:hypothetical protein